MKHIFIVLLSFFICTSYAQKDHHPNIHWEHGNDQIGLESQKPQTAPTAPKPAKDPGYQGI